MPSAPNPYTRRVERLTRLRRGIAAALVLGAVALAATYFVQRRRHPAPTAPLLGLQVQQSAAGVDISKSVNGRPVFRVYASRADKLRSGGVVALHQVRILVYDGQGRNADEISGAAFRYDQASGDLQADGLVHIQLERQVDLTARGLRYNVKQGTGSIAHGVLFAMGGARGRAASVELDSHRGQASFAGGVQLDWPRARQPDLNLRSDSARLQRLSSGAVTINLDGHAYLRQGVQSLAADHFVVAVSPTYALQRLDASGHVLATNATVSEPLRVRADTGHAEFTRATQKLQRLELDGHVLAEQTQTLRGQQQLRRLRAGQLALRFAPANILHMLIARQNAVLTETGAVPQRLAAPELDFAFGPSAARRPVPSLIAVSSQGRTEIVRGPLRAAADQLQLTLAGNQQPRLLRARGHVAVHQTVNGIERTSQSQSLQIEFSPSAGRGAQPGKVVETGDVQLRAGERELSAQQLTYTPADGKAILTGSVHGSDPQAAFSAEAATWISHPDGSASLSAHAAPEGHIELSLSGRPSNVGPMLAANRPVVITAGSVHWDQPAGPKPTSAASFRGTAVFTGSVRLLQAPSLLRAGRLTITAGANGMPAQLLATGDVQTDFLANRSSVGSLNRQLTHTAAGHERAVRVRARQLVYSAAAHQARYSGAVRLAVDDATLSAPQLTIYLSTSGNSPSLERAQATGGVALRQPGRSAHAARLSYDFASNQVRLDGGPPSILDAEHGKITGDPLTFSLSSDEIQVGGKSGTRVLGKTKGRN